MNTIEYTDMPGSDVSFWPFLLFVGAAFGGYSCIDFFHKWKRSTEAFEQVQKDVEDMKVYQETQQFTLDEHRELIREKKDYDETSEVEEGKFQAWEGEVSQGNGQMKITIWRVNKSSIQKNQEWIAWNGDADASCIVRDFYLGNSNPDFVWKRMGEQGLVDETLVNGWDSVIRIRIVADGVKEDYNDFLKKCLTGELVQWSRVLIPSS